MYQSNITSHYNRHYGRAKTSVLDSPSKMLLQNKRMLEDESEDEFSSNDKLDGKQRVTEQKLGRIMFLVTLAVLLGNLLKAASTSILSCHPLQWMSELKFPESLMDWRPEVGGKLLSPVLWGLGVTAVTWIMIYFDSRVPGVDPRLPAKKEIVNPRSWPIAYWTSLLCGFLVLLTVALLQL